MRTIGRMPDDTARSFLAALATGQGPIRADRLAVVIAHPDDETIGCGGQLGRLRHARIFVVTDGAPRDLVDARRAGFASAAAYAACRKRELAAALEMTENDTLHVSYLSVPDQEAARHAAALARDLADRLVEAGVAVVVTHAYEGGHPDHDATALAVHMAARRAGRRGRSIGLIEMPFYHQGPAGVVLQRFADDRGPELVMALTPAQSVVKRCMLAAHASQAGTLSVFTTAAERFRPATAYDFASVPNDGRLLYEQHAWGLDGAGWERAARRALSQLDTDGGAC